MNATTRRIALPILTTVLVLLAALPLLAHPAAVEAQVIPDQGSADLDGDGLNDSREIQLGTRLGDPDTDDDGANDGDEIAAGTDPLDPASVPGNGATDTDGDGLSDAQEQQLGTDPRDVDSDNDRLSDGFEAREFGTDPLRADSDEDGLGDGDELEVYQTDALAADTDEDGVDDATEIDAGSDPTSVPGGTAQTNSITITKYLCPVGYEGKDPFTDCAEELAGIAFTVSLDESEFAQSKTTGADGVVSFGGLGSGNFTISEDIPGDANDFSANCFGEPAPGAPEPRQIVFTRMDANSVGLTLGQGEVIECTWFNTPVDAGQPSPSPGDLLVQAFTCPAGYTGSDYVG